MAGRVLIVEDDYDSRTLLGELIRLDGFTCVEASCAECALEAKPESFDVLLVDHFLGIGLTGSQFVEHLLDTGLVRAERIALCTAERYIRPPVGVTLFAKPLPMNDVRAFVRRACSLSDARSA